VRRGQVPSPGAVRPELPAEVCELVQRTLSLEVESRPDSARTLYEELQRAMRLHGLVASAFDLADYLQDLFPESRGDQSQPSVRTAPGRRADELALPDRAGEPRQVDEQRTIHYLQQRHPDAPAQDPHTPSVTATAHRGPRWGRYLAIAGVVGIIAAAGSIGVGLFTRGSRPAAPIDARVAAATRRDRGMPPSRADTAAIAARRAELRVRSAPPGAWVVIDGTRHPDVTPLVARLDPGEHTCVVGMKGHRSWRGRVEVRLGEPVELERRLEALPALLSVRSSHPCRLSINGRTAGQTPLSERVVTAGPLELRCQETGGATAHRRVRATPGETTRVTLGFGVLNINVEPWAEVTVDGARRGTTPLRLLLAEGEHRVELRNVEKNLRRSATVTMSPAAPTRISSW
jgi:hypothetical protein